MKSKNKKYLILILISLVILILDQVTKVAVDDQFRLGESLAVVSDFFNLTYVRNTGAAFGFMADADPMFRVPFFLIIPIFALGFIIYLFRKVESQHFSVSIALSLVVGRAVGNLIDRVRLGYVIDFLDFHWGGKYHFPAFNVADSAICVGVAILMIDLIRTSIEEKKEKSNASTTH